MIKNGQSKECHVQSWTMKTMLTAALVVIAACGGILLGLTAPVLGQSAADRSETRELARHFE
jgi:hypothetical protein